MEKIKTTGGKAQDEKLNLIHLFRKTHLSFAPLSIDCRRKYDDSFNKLGARIIASNSLSYLTSLQNKKERVKFPIRPKT